jgi:hypothetical protein
MLESGSGHMIFLAIRMGFATMEVLIQSQNSPCAVYSQHIMGVGFSEYLFSSAILHAICTFHSECQ